MENGDPDNKDDLYKGAQTAIMIAGREPQEFTKRAGPLEGPKLPGEAPTVKKQPESRPKPEASIQSDPGPSHEEPAELSNPPLDFELPLEHEHGFLTDRGITPELARSFGVGYCAQGIMKQRIAIKIHNEQGELVAYAGRYASDELPAGVERYRLPKKFHKSLVLYNLWRAKELGKRHLVVVEGYWSAIRLHREGIPAAALMGTTCSAHQAELVVSAGFKFVTVILDGDDAGRKAIPEVVTTLARKVYVRTIELPEGIKPDTMSVEYLDRLR
jgi:DNA primase